MSRFAFKSLCTKERSVALEILKEKLILDLFFLDISVLFSCLHPMILPYVAISLLRQMCIQDDPNLKYFLD